LASFACLALILSSILMASAASHAQVGTVTARVAVVRNTSSKQQNADVVVWLSPLQPQSNPYSFPQDTKPARLVQKNKTFEPHLLVVRAGSVVEFPNSDPFFHNVFSLFEGKRFDLGLYEAGSTRTVRFDRPGVSYIFCNIHSQMSAVIVALDTPYYSVSSRDGSVAIPNVPPGRYLLQVWHEGSSPRSLNILRREVAVSTGDNQLGVLRVPEDHQPVAHKNKYGRDYDEPQPSSPVYPQP
jgi:plastocyanin